MSMPNSSNCNYSPLLLCESSVFKPQWEKFSSLVLLVKMVLRYAMSLHVLFSFMMTCMVMSVQGELTKVPLRPYLRGNPGLLPQAISPRHDISVVKRVEDCEGQVGCLLKDGAPLPELATIAPSSEFVSIAPLSELISPGRRFPFEALSQKNQACTQNKDGSDTEDDNDDDDGDAEDQDDDDDANDEDFSGEEGGDDDEEEGDPEEDPAANGNEGSDDDDDDGDEGGDDDDDDDDDGDEEEEEDEEEDEDQPPAKKRK